MSPAPPRSSPSAAAASSSTPSLVPASRCSSSSAVWSTNRYTPADIVSGLSRMRSRPARSMMFWPVTDRTPASIPPGTVSVASVTSSGRSPPRPVPACWSRHGSSPTRSCSPGSSATARSSSSRTSRCCPGIVDAACAMPDIHQGYGFPVGGIAATAVPDGVVSPGGVGYDINCGVRLLALPLSCEELGSRREAFVHEISRAIPAGAGKRGELHFEGVRLDRLLAEGPGFLVSELGDRHRGRPRAHRILRLHPRRRSPCGLGARPPAWLRPGRHDRLREPFRRGPAGGADLRPRGGRRLRPPRRAGHGPHPLRLARARSPGVHRPRARHGRRADAVSHLAPRPAARVRAPVVPGRKGLSGGDGRRRQLRVREPPRDGARGARGGAADPRAGRGGRHAAALRRGAQHREGRASRRQGRLRPPQGGDAGVPGRVAGDPRRLPERRAAGVHPREHGDSELRARGRGGRDGALVRHHVPRRRPPALDAQGRAGRSAAARSGESSRPRGSSSAARRTRASRRRHRWPTRTWSVSSTSSPGPGSRGASHVSGLSASSRASLESWVAPDARCP